jgi:proteasome lid subunit RPN8/RPN11
VILIVPRVLEDVLAHMRDEAPRECCGVLVGVAGRIVDSRRAANLAPETTRFQIDPRDHIRAIHDARARQLDVVGFYHSHPHSPARPSETYVAEAGYAGAMHLIAGVSAEGRSEVRLFVIDGTDVRELEFAREEGQ